MESGKQVVKIIWEINLLCSKKLQKANAPCCWCHTEFSKSGLWM